MKKLEIEKTKPTFIISTFKTDMIRVGLVFSISNCFIAKMSLANNWRSFSSSYLALASNYFFSQFEINHMIQQPKFRENVKHLILFRLDFHVITPFWFSSIRMSLSYFRISLHISVVFHLG